MNIKKPFLIVLLFFLLRIIQSCCTCPDVAELFDFNRITFRNLDNSGTYTTWASGDTMYSAAVAFEVYVSGEPEYFSINERILDIFAFSEASATQCDCDPLFKARDPIVDISIQTLFPIPGIAVEGEDVTDYFYTMGHGRLYEEMAILPDLINYEVYSGEAMTSFRVYCRENILSDTAQFLFSIELGNGSILMATTSIIHLLPSNPF
jgi:hypothetical protein